MLRRTRSMTCADPTVRPWSEPVLAALGFGLTFTLVLAAPAPADLLEIGANDFRISFVGGTGDPAFDVRDTAVAYSPDDDLYLVAWITEQERVGTNRWTIETVLLDGASGLPASSVWTVSFWNCEGCLSFPPSVAADYSPSTGWFVVAYNKPRGVDEPVDFEIWAFSVITPLGTPFWHKRLSYVGGSDPAFNAFEPDVACSSLSNECLVVWSADDPVGGMVDGEFEIFGQLVAAPTGAEVGVDDFRISEMGGTGSNLYDASSPAVAYNPDNNEYLVVWEGDHNAGGLVDSEFEIFGRRLNENGTAQGDGHIRISEMGGTGDRFFDAFEPSVAYNPVEQEYLVVWEGDHNLGGLVEDEFEIFGQRLDPLGAAIAPNDFRISEMGGTGDPGFRARGPAVAHHPVDDGYLVVWWGDHNAGGLVLVEFEIFGQQLDRQGAEIGSDVRLSDMGGTGNNPFDAGVPDLVYNPTRNEYLVVWWGDDDVGGQFDDEFEAFGQRLKVVIFADGFESRDTSAWSLTVP